MLSKNHRKSYSVDLNDSLEAILGKTRDRSQEVSSSAWRSVRISVSHGSQTSVRCFARVPLTADYKVNTTEFLNGLCNSVVKLLRTTDIGLCGQTCLSGCL